jgi:glycerol-3-phosphate dehydrogenase subunit B
MPISESTCELAVIGAGLAGLTTALFAANRGISTVLVGGSGQTHLGSGLIDLMGVHQGKRWTMPWDAVDALRKDLPEHPLARITPSTIREAINELLTFLSSARLDYHVRENRNCKVLTAVGTTKITYGAPLSVWRGIDGFEKKMPALLVDFYGLKGFSARQIAEVAGSSWPGLTYTTIAYPEFTGELYAEHLARELDSPGARSRLAQSIAPRIKDAAMVGLPGVLGLERSAEAHAHFETLLGMPVFEIPTLPPSPVGLRIIRAFETGLPAKGVNMHCPQRVLKTTGGTDNDFCLHIGSHTPVLKLQAKAVVLATGRFFSQGLVADLEGIREPVFNLPVSQPANRENWHRETFLAPDGHAVNTAGIETDASFRPLAANGKPLFQHLYAAGSILAHQDWMRTKCGSGLAAATAMAAVKAYKESRS